MKIYNKTIDKMSYTFAEYVADFKKNELNIVASTLGVLILLFSILIIIRQRNKIKEITQPD